MLGDIFIKDSRNSTQQRISTQEFLILLEEFKRIYKLYNREITYSRIKHMIKSIKNIKLFLISELPFCFKELERTLIQLRENFLKESFSKDLEKKLLQKIKNYKNMQFNGIVLIC